MPNPNLIIEQVELGPMANFIYFIGDSQSKEVAVVDVAWDVPFIFRKAIDMNVKITAVFLTHGHPDHVNGIEELLETINVPVYLSEHEAEMYTPKIEGLKRVGDGDLLSVGNIDFKCIHTPGHTPGGQCFYTKGHLITGDTLFVDACGRIDLPGGDGNILRKSLAKIAQFPKDTVVYPGHDYGKTKTDTIQNQLKTNPFLNDITEAELQQNKRGV